MDNYSWLCEKSSELLNYVCLTYLVYFSKAFIGKGFYIYIYNNLRKFKEESAILKNENGVSPFGRVLVNLLLKFPGIYLILNKIKQSFMDGRMISIITAASFLFFLKENKYIDEVPFVLFLSIWIWYFKRRENRNIKYYNVYMLQPILLRIISSWIFHQLESRFLRY